MFLDICVRVLKKKFDSFVQLLNVLFSPKMFDEHLEYGLEIRLN